jgi:hypothetical protein
VSLVVGSLLFSSLRFCLFGSEALGFFTRFISRTRSEHNAVCLPNPALRDDCREIRLIGLLAGGDVLLDKLRLVDQLLSPQFFLTIPVCQGG